MADAIGEKEYELKDPLPIAVLRQGFDVWLANPRGSLYSRDHDTDEPNGRKFYQSWDYYNYSVDNLGLTDQVAAVDFIIEYSKHKKLSYIGYSLGNMQMLIALSSQAEVIQTKLVNKVDRFVTLAPCPIMDLFFEEAVMPTILPSVYETLYGQVENQEALSDEQLVEA